MKIFTEPNEKYRQYYVGARWRNSPQEAELLIGSRILEEPIQNAPPGPQQVVGAYNTYEIDPITGVRDLSKDEVSDNRSIS